MSNMAVLLILQLNRCICFWKQSLIAHTNWLSSLKGGGELKDLRFLRVSIVMLPLFGIKKVVFEMFEVRECGCKIND